MHALILALAFVSQAPECAPCNCRQCAVHHPAPNVGPGPAPVLPCPPVPGKVTPTPQAPACLGANCTCAVCRPNQTCEGAYGVCHPFVHPAAYAPVCNPAVAAPVYEVRYRVRVRHRFFGGGGGCCGR